MNKLIKNILIIALTLPLITGCEDFLDAHRYTEKDSSTFPRTEHDVNEMVTGVYNMLSIASNSGRNVESSYFFVAELAADERFGGGGMNDFDFQAFGHHLYVNPDMFNTGWRDRYLGIARANDALAAMDLFPDGETKEQKTGELKTLRAMFYFELVQLMGDVPIVMAAPPNVQAAVDVPPQSPQADVFKSIATDLWEAYHQMPAHSWNRYPSGTMTKWAAGGLLARVYLFYTGFYRTGLDPWAQDENPNAPVLATLPREGGEITKSDVITILENIRDKSGHSLLPDFRSNWGYTNTATARHYAFAQQPNHDGTAAKPWVKDGANQEAVLLVKCAPHQSNFRNALSLYFGLRQGSRNWSHSFPFGRGWGSGAVNTKMWDDWEEWEATDFRRAASIYHFEHENLPAPYQFGMETQYEETGLWQKKYMPFTAIRSDGVEPLWICWEFAPEPDGFGIGQLMGQFQNGNGTDIKLMRYADILLMHSELTETNNGINTVRARVGLSPVAYSQENLRNERRFELAFEGTRWTDIRRWHIATQVLANKYGATINNIDAVTTQRPQSQGGVVERYKKTKGFWMKPQTQLNLAGDALKQNPGWGTPDAVYSFWRSSL
jgi:hypothetical protein